MNLVRLRLRGHEIAGASIDLCTGTGSVAQFASGPTTDAGPLNQPRTSQATAGDYVSNLGIYPSEMFSILSDDSITEYLTQVIDIFRFKLDEAARMV